jgi:poly-gamma-glutamate synthase PgsB/CapB
MLIVLLIIIFVLLLYLITENRLLNRRISAIPLRITVTGTRGKSGVVRLLTSVLREDGKRVLGKITGSHARLLFSGEDEVPLKRGILPTILEQKNIIRIAAFSHVDCLVCEIMSIHAENRRMESQKLLKPHIVIVTNIRNDHTDAMGKTEDDIAKHFCLDIPKGATVFVPDNRHRKLFDQHAEKQKGFCIAVEEAGSRVLSKEFGELEKRHFIENLDVVYAVCSHLGIDDRTIGRGLLKVQAAESLQIKTVQINGKTFYCVNAFGANDPESTFEVIEIIKKRIPSYTTGPVGILNLRPDREDRTLQWIKVLKNAKNPPFKELFILGGHGRIVQRTVKQGCFITMKKSEKIMQRIADASDDGSVIVGFGNRKGPGGELVCYWERMCADAGV